MGFFASYSPALHSSKKIKSPRQLMPTRRVKERMMNHNNNEEQHTNYSQNGKTVEK